MKCLLVLCVNSILLIKTEVAAVDVQEDKNSFNPFPLFSVLRNEMSTDNLTFIINCVQRDYYRYEFAIEMFLKKIPTAYRIVQMDSVDFRLYIAKHILHTLTTSGDQWFDIFMLCWDDGRNRSSDSRRVQPMDHLLEIFREKSHELGNVRWIFFTWEKILRSIQKICGVVYVDLKSGSPLIYSESIEEIRKCGGRMVFLDYEGGREHLLREPFRTNATIFEHEISFQRLGYLSVLCEFGSSKNFCAEHPQREIFHELSKKINITKLRSDAANFGKCIDEESDDIFQRARCDGFLADMQRRIFDVCAVNIYPTENISMALDFVSSYYRFDQLTFFAPPAIRIIGSFQSILLPFENDVWLSIGLSIIVSCIILSLLTKRAFDSFGLANHVFYVTMLATGRVPVIPDRFYRVTYITIMLASLLLANFLLSQFYAGTLTSFRQHPPTTSVIDTLVALEKILKNPSETLKIAVLNDTKYNAILNPRQPTELMKLLKNHTTPCGSKYDCVELVIKRQHVLLATDFNLLSEIGMNPQTQAITRAKDNILAARYSVPIQRGSPVTKQIMTFNGKLFDGGIFQRLENDYILRTKPNFEKEKPLPPCSEMTVKDLKGLMLLYAGSVLISVTSFIVEEIFYWTLRFIRKRDEPQPSLFTPRSTPLAADKYPSEYFENIRRGLPFYSVGSDSALQTHGSETRLRTFKPKSKRLVLLCDKDGHTLDLVYM